LKRGTLVTFEGNDGSGKSTQIRLLHDALERAGKKVFLTREPGGTRIGDALRVVLLDNRHEGMTRECEVLLYMASRAQLVDEVIAGKLKEGVVVLCDRWLDATVAYQGYGAGADVKWIKELGRRATRGVVPKLTLFFDLPLEMGLRRAKSHRAADRIERKDLAFHQRVRRGFLRILKDEARRVKSVPVRPDETPEEIHEKVMRLVEHVL